MKREAHGLMDSEMARLIIEAAEDYIYVVGPDLCLRYVNAAGAAVFHATPDRLIGRRIREIFGAGALRHEQSVRRILKTGISMYEERTYAMPGGATWMSARLAPVRDETGAIRFVVGISRDISERKRLEAALTEAGRRERMQVGHLLHDTLGQELTGLSFLSKAMEQNLARAGHPEAGNAAEISALLRDTIKQTRLMVRGLLPVDTLEEGFHTAVLELCDFARRIYGVTCTCGSRRPWRIHDHQVATNLYYIASEAVKNGARHGKATRVRIGLTTSKGLGCLTIADNGSGMPADPFQSPGMGLRIMRYRAQMVGGALRFEPNSPRGTRVLCTFPNGL